MCVALLMEWSEAQSAAGSVRGRVMAGLVWSTGRSGVFGGILGLRMGHPRQLLPLLAGRTKVVSRVVQFDLRECYIFLLISPDNTAAHISVRFGSVSTNHTDSLSHNISSVWGSPPAHTDTNTHLT